jgi:hypothetical protein
MVWHDKAVVCVQMPPPERIPQAFGAGPSPTPRIVRPWSGRPPDPPTPLVSADNDAVTPWERGSTDRAASRLGDGWPVAGVDAFGAAWGDQAASVAAGRDFGLRRNL